jgi:hypothetical protein
MYMWLKGELVRQRHGCPMGSNLSPAKAVITCSPPEAELMKQARLAGATVITARYMDDVALLVAYDRRCEVSEDAATRLVESVREMYPEPLRLEIEPERREHDFLESTFLVQGGQVWVRLKS